MADVTPSIDEHEAEVINVRSDFEKYLNKNGELGQQMAKILVTLYNQQVKPEDVKPTLKAMFDIQDVDMDAINQMKQENLEL